MAESVGRSREGASPSTGSAFLCAGRSDLARGLWGQRETVVSRSRCCRCRIGWCWRIFDRWHRKAGGERFERFEWFGRDRWREWGCIGRYGRRLCGDGVGGVAGGSSGGPAARANGR